MQATIDHTENEQAIVAVARRDFRDRRRLIKVDITAQRNTILLDVRRILDRIELDYRDSLYIHRRGAVKCHAIYYSTPPGWIGHRVHVQ